MRERGKWGVGELGRGRRRIHRMREGREVKTESARGDVDDRIYRAERGREKAYYEGVGKRMEGLLEGGEGGGFVLHPVGVWSSLALAALFSQSPSLNQEEEQRYACY